ncbi:MULTISPECIES: potassium-transporting ATPase subunit KdpC [unclassified Frigoribacterium]|uniref:potassium-transporting ATPase subunit KdpC n=1 Tax=unclassified Frigoribacterium TaxID=2627005 RepID=UPI0006F54BF5|nr:MULTISPECIES: potassium-transporting ATPase subunit KdpC [unclassified Frigoribacterium]KQO81570.1 potassium transporter KtrA [Frigoribacterium sp. Leaf263]KQR65880.1 potassium transporter KtrA [Frigoribacterium sp. Leaf172]
MNTRTLFRQHGVALRAMLVFTLLLGVVYTAVVTGIGQVALSGRADGSAVRLDGETVGSSLIGQSFTDADGVALPEWFQSRPSAAGDGYDASASSGSNLGPESDDLVTAVEERRAAIAESDGVDPASIPVDALTASGSGLDPHISPAYARLQIARVAAARDLPADEVSALVESHVQGRDLGYLGEPTVNVLELNVALAATAG